MEYVFAGFDWDEGNRSKCQKHGVSRAEIEGLFARPVMILPDAAHSQTEERLRAIGHTRQGRAVLSFLRSGSATAIHSASQRPLHASRGG